MSSNQWCIIVNKTTCFKSGWKKWQRLLDANDIQCSLYGTNSVNEFSDIIQKLVGSGNKYFLFVGGDGTIHHGGNLLLYHAAERAKDIVIGMLPCGTGNDWVRSFGVPKEDLIESLRKKTSAPLNILRIEWPDGHVHFAMNMLGAALDAAVVDLLNEKGYSKSSALKYPVALLKTLLKPHHWPGTLIVDGTNFQNDWLTIEAGFGKYCGGGMYVLPHANGNQAGLLMMKQKSLAKILINLPKVYNGKIAQQKEAIAMHFQSLEIHHTLKPIPLEADGEWLGYTPVTITPVYGAMRRIV